MNTLCLICCVSGVAFFLLSVAVFPSIKIKNKSVAIYWLPPLFAALALIAFNCVDLPDVWKSLTANSSINPLKILVLFFSLTAISVFLDEAGFFELLAYWVLIKAKKSQTFLFTVLFFTVSLLTVFTSNDIVILTFTPFICYFCKNAKINPLPYLVGEFVAANTFSLLLIIGNPTNIYLGASFSVSFEQYFIKMALPALAGGVTAFLVLFLFFNKTLKKPLISDVLPPSKKNKFLMVLGLVILTGCTLMLTVSGYLNIEMWQICLCFALILFMIAAIYFLATKQRAIAIKSTFKRIPYLLAPFILSMFVMVLALEKNGFTEKIAQMLTMGNNVFSFGAASYLFSNIINNIPMSVLFSSVCAKLSNPLPAVFASIVGSNYGALLTPVGALAGIMWTDLLKTHGVSMRLPKFVLYCGVCSIISLFVTLLVLNFII